MSEKFKGNGELQKGKKPEQGKGESDFKRETEIMRGEIIAILDKGKGILEKIDQFLRQGQKECEEFIKGGRKVEWDRLEGFSRFYQGKKIAGDFLLEIERLRTKVKQNKPLTAALKADFERLESLHEKIHCLFEVSGVFLWAYAENPQIGEEIIGDDATINIITRVAEDHLTFTVSTENFDVLTGERTGEPYPRTLSLRQIQEGIWWVRDLITKREKDLMEEPLDIIKESEDPRA